MKILVKLAEVAKIVVIHNQPVGEFVETERAARLAINEDTVNNSVHMANHTMKDNLFLLALNRMPRHAGEVQQHLFEDVPVEELDPVLYGDCPHPFRLVNHVPKLPLAGLAYVAHPQHGPGVFILQAMGDLSREGGGEAYEQFVRENDLVVPEQGVDVFNQCGNVFDEILPGRKRVGRLTRICTPHRSAPALRVK